MNWYIAAERPNTTIEDVVIKGNPNDPSDDYFVKFLDDHVSRIITDLIFRKEIPYNINRMKLKDQIRRAIRDFASSEEERIGKKIKPWKWLLSDDGKKSYRKVEKAVLKKYKQEAKAAMDRARGISPLPMGDQQQQGKGAPGAPPGGGMLL